MGYPTCELILDEKLRKPLPVTFLEHDEVRKRLKEGEDPIVLSKEKWIRILVFLEWLAKMPHREK